MTHVHMFFSILLYAMTHVRTYVLFSASGLIISLIRTLIDFIIMLNYLLLNNLEYFANITCALN